MTERPILFSGPMVRAILDGSKTQTRRIMKPRPPSVEAVKQRAGTDFCLFTDARTPGQWRVGGPVWAVRELMGAEPGWRCPYGTTGDRLWVRETWAPADWLADGTTPDPAQTIAYRADLSAVVFGKLIARPADTYAWNWDILKWRPSIHMPRWASRIDLEITGVRVERLQSITEEDARAEGVEPTGPVGCGCEGDDDDPGEHIAACPWGVDTDLDPDETPYVAAFGVLWNALHGPDSWKANPWVWVVSFKRVRP